MRACGWSRFGWRNWPFESANQQISNPQSIAGFFVPDTRNRGPRSRWARRVLPTVDEIKPDGFLPSSRSVAYTKTAWAAAGGYPEWIDYCEDLIFDLRGRHAVGPFVGCLKAVAHFQPCSSLKAFAKQYYRYARGDGKADLWRKRHLIRYATYLIALPGLIGLSVFHSSGWWLVLLAGAMFYCASPYRRLRPRLAELPLGGPAPRDPLLVIRLVGDVAKMLGYPAGWIWRVRNWERPEIHWRQPAPNMDRG